MQNLIHQAKYNYRPKLLRNFLTTIAWNGLYGEKPDIIIPVPLHKNKLKTREFNQAEIIAKWISNKTSIPIDNTLLIRTKNTDAQAAIDDEKQRKQNVENAFLAAGEKKYNTVMLIDDVMTTGNTLSECAKVLKQSGVIKVISYTLIRAG